MVMHGVHVFGISVGRVIAILAFIAVSAYLDVVHVLADDGGWYVDETMKFLADDPDAKKEAWSVTWAILLVIPIMVVVGAFFVMRIRLRNRSHEQTPLSGAKK
jgi:heme/copper-type cytochrome/quinol oxidase subunit 2